MSIYTIRYIFRLFMEKFRNWVYYFVYIYMVLYIYIIESKFKKLIFPTRVKDVYTHAGEGRQGMWRTNKHLMSCMSSYYSPKWLLNTCSLLQDKITLEPSFVSSVLPSASQRYLYHIHIPDLQSKRYMPLGHIGFCKFRLQALFILDTKLFPCQILFLLLVAKGWLYNT